MQQVSFPSGIVDYWFQGAFANIWQYTTPDDVVVLTDEHVAAAHPQLFAGLRTLILPAGEDAKRLQVVADIAQQLIALEATHKTCLVGVGGGVVTDFTGFVAAVYMRGIRFGFVPTTILAMADAAIGGKNGVNLGLHKNIIGTITQPSFIIYDHALTGTLPQAEWSSGFAEVIKYACLFDAGLFGELEAHNLGYYQQNRAACAALIARCAGWKNKTVAEDEHERGIRKLLNFGHTAAHAIEQLYHLAHGEAVAIGMMVACQLSERECGLAPGITQRLAALLQRYALPTTIPMQTEQVMSLLKMDKKRQGATIDYILLADIAQPQIKPLLPDTIADVIRLYESDN